MRIDSALVTGSLVGGAVAQAAQNFIGFNSGATLDDYKAKQESDFLAEFKAAKQLPGTDGKFTTVRLFTTRQANTKDDPIAAFSAAVQTNTSILLGVWASGTKNISDEISAMNKAIEEHGKSLTDLIVGCSIGSEDVYRNSDLGKKNKAGVGNTPDALVEFIKQWRDAFNNTALRNVPVGHVDTWDVWPNKEMKPLIDAVDWIGLDAYSYYMSDQNNDITNIVELFDNSLNSTQSVADGKPIWLTEIGWPSSGPKWNNGIPSIKNAKYFWDTIGCGKLFNKMPTFWYILRDSNPENKMKFAITEKDNLQKPLFDLSCPAQSGSGFDSSTTVASSNPPNVDSVRGAAAQQKTSLALFAGIVLASTLFVL
ncbi:putative glucan endo-1,3-beta-glucosidase eglC [Hirsutella rhossiliensis]|uniref:Glucan endo-1,3-beta-glucosidase eglC n=1 Tax=Hirsutella rhossiliensis TaxID=111463 RepID=A0A9P8N2V8_9HYPO|nr:putative glucan endo-1,3-beta-glucosidase eglC [Hirsutella rhossiliensis]KAH0965845.1 putative glucan endo-1,3-beta-glucosidase eglC [Hirsutella rhossiliensis]